MKLMEINWQPGERQLRQFGLLCLVLFPLLGWWWGGGRLPAITIPGGVGLLLAAVGILRPIWLRPLFVALCLLAWPIGLIVGELALLLVYYGVITPLGLLRRACGRDGLERGLDREAASYWQPKRRPNDRRSYGRQW